MTVATSKKTKEKNTNPKGKRSQKVQPIGKEYKFSQAETATYGMISAKFALADEKTKSAVEIRQTATMLQQQWAQNLLAQRSIKNTDKVNIDVDKGIITVMPTGKK